MDEESFKHFYPEEWDKQQEVSGQADTSTQIANPRDVLLERFKERMLLEKQEEERIQTMNDFDKLSNLKKDMVRRKIKKFIRRNQRGKSSSQV